jgi:UDP-N-acetylmuramoyl-tripeptide--D-alanyl-D-alanine ligase
MTRLLSRYHPRYVRSLIYMLQACEYSVRDFFAWLSRVRDFRRVERRKHIEWTAKAKALAAVAWAFIAAMVLIIVLGIVSDSDIPHVVAVLLIIATPLMLPYVLAAAVEVGQLLQLPMEAYRLSVAKKQLAAHRGIKIAIAGSFGKTSMREILRTVLSEGKSVAAPGGSENTPLGVARFVNQLKGDEEVLIFELGEYYPGDVRRLCEVVKPEFGIITGVNEAHLEKFKTLERAANTIFELAPFVAPEKLYINGENETARARAEDGNVVYTRSGAGEVRITDARTGLDGTVFSVNGAPVHSRLLGLHHLGALAAAVDIARQLGLSQEQVARGIEKTKPFAHRLERRPDEHGVVTLDDSYNGNPDGVAAVIEFLATLTGRRFYVTPGLVEMGARKEEVHRDIGRSLAAAGIEKVVLIRNSVTPLIELGLKESGYKGEVLWFDDALACYAALPRMTVAGDIVLLQNDWPDQYC